MSDKTEFSRTVSVTDVSNIALEIIDSKLNVQN